jgi:hypothetical protein
MAENNRVKKFNQMLLWRLTCNSPSIFKLGVWLIITKSAPVTYWQTLTQP